VIKEGNLVSEKMRQMVKKTMVDLVIKSLLIYAASNLRTKAASQ